MAKRQVVHKYIYIFILGLLAFFMPVSEFMTSTCQFALLTNYILELNFREKFNRLKQNKDLIFFLFLFFCPLIWLFNTTDFQYATNDIVIKLPFLALPLIIGTSQKIEERKLIFVLMAFIAGVLFSSIVGFLAYNHIITEIVPIKNIRNMSPFVNSIRLSLMCALSVFFLIYWIKKSIFKNIFINILLIISMLWCISFIIKIGGLTAIIASVVLIFILLCIWVKRENRRKIKILKTIAVTSFPALIIAYLSFCVIDYYTPTAVQNDCDTTLLGNKYNPFSPQQDNITRENGNFVYCDICWTELNTYWKNYSSYDLNSQANNGIQTVYALLFYMTSKGLKKDANGLSQLTPEDIKNIENGCQNYKTSRFGLSKRIKTTIFDLEICFRGKEANDLSIAQRLEAQRAGIQLFKQNFWFGCGTGDVKISYKNYYDSINSPLTEKNRKRSHNQFLTNFIAYGTFGGLICIFVWFLPFLKNRKNINYYFLSFFIIASLSMFSDDMFETSTAVAFIAFFYSVCCWGKIDD